MIADLTNWLCRNPGRVSGALFTFTLAMAALSAALGRIDDIDTRVASALGDVDE